MKHGMKNLSGKLIGGALLAAGIAGIFLIKAKPQAQPEDTAVRPIKSAVAGAGTVWPKLYFPGTIEADSEVDLSFEVGGRLVEFPVRRGMKVKKDDVLGRIDPSNFENQVKNAEADLEQARSSLERIERALKVNAVSQEEASQARAAVLKAEAQLAIQRKALADTVLKASFGGRVSETYADQFDAVSPGRAVLKLQNIDTLAIAVSVPESYVMWATPGQLEEVKFHVEFDALPATHVPATLKEVATVADPVTQTYRARFSFPNPEKVLLLPGMSGTLVVDVLHPEIETLPLVPSNAVGFDSAGAAFVWVLEDQGDGVCAARQRTVQLGVRNGEDIEVAKGLAMGERIAVAGVAILTEGRLVRPLEETEAEPDAAAESESPAEAAPDAGGAAEATP